MDTNYLLDRVTESDARLTTVESDKEDTANKSAPSGYASLDAGSKVPIAELPTGSSSTTVCIGNDGRLSDQRTPTDNSVSTVKIQDAAVSYAKIQDVSAGDKVLGRISGAGDVEEIACTSAGRALIDDASAAAQRDTLGVEQLVGQAVAGDVAINSTSVVNIASASIDVAAGNTFKFELTGAILNNSGGARTYTVRITIDTTTFDLAFDNTIAASASNRSHIEISGQVGVHSSSLIFATIHVIRGTPNALGTAAANVLAQDRRVANRSTNNVVGSSKTVAIGLFSSDATATQTFHVTDCSIYK